MAKPFVFNGLIVFLVEGEFDMSRVETILCFLLLEAIMMTRFKLPSILLMIFGICAISHPHGVLAKQKTVVVGVITQESSIDKAPDDIGTFYRINLEYLTNISKVLGLKLEFRPYTDISTLLDEIETGVIDGAVGFSQTPKRLERFLFTKPFFSSTTSAWYRKRDIKAIPHEQITWVCVDGSVYCEYIEDSGATSIVRTQTRAQAFSMVHDGRADALVSTYVAINEYLDTQNIIKGSVDIPSWLKEEEVRFITSKSNLWLVEEINKILDWESHGKNIRSVASNNPYHINDKLLSEYRRDIGHNKIITYSTSDQAYPFLYFDPKTELREGFLSDFIELIQSRTGLKFEYVPPSSSFDSGLTAFDSDIVPVAYYDHMLTADWLITKPFMRTQYLAVETIGIEDKNAGQQPVGILMSLKKQGVVYLESWKRDSFIRYEDVKTLISDLKMGSISSAYIPEDIIYSMIAQSSFDGLRIDEQEVMNLSVAFAVGAGNIRLKNILDSIIATIDSNETDKLMRTYRNFNLTYGYDKEHIARAALVAFLLIIASLGVVYFILKHLKLKVDLARVHATNEEKEKQWLMTIIQQINSIVFIHSSDNKIQMSNCLLYLSGDCKGCPMSDAVTGSPLVQNENELASVLDGQRVAEAVSLKECKLPIKHIYRERKAILSPSNNNAFVLTVLHDTTEQYEREKALLSAKKEAQAAIHARENFLATMSHELRTPISAIHGLLDLVMRNTQDFSQKELVGQAIWSLEHLNTLVDEVLDFSKLDAGQLKIIPKEVDLLSIVCDVLRTFETKATDKGLEYKVNIRPFANKNVMLDAMRFVQICSNLLSNAVKFTSDGEIETTIVLHQKLLVISIADTGIGMTQKQLQCIRQPFVQADDSITREFGGTGLGLSIVDRLVSCMGGEFNIESKYGQGSTMVAKLPIDVIESPLRFQPTYTYSPLLPYRVRKWCKVWGMVESKLDPDFTCESHENDGQYEFVWNHKDGERTTMSESELVYPDRLLIMFSDNELTEQENYSRVHNFDLQGGEVLVVEDNKINQSVIRMQLKELGICPVIVNDGLEALDYLEQHSGLKLVITDFHMPRMDGYQLIRTLKKSPTLRTLPVIGLTAEDSRLANDRALNTAIDDILYKPYDLKQLSDAIFKQLGVDKSSTIPSWIEKFEVNEACEIASVFVSSMSEDIDRLKRAENEHEKRQIIHGMKGALGVIDAKDAAALCEKVEKSSDLSFANLLFELISTIETEIEILKRWDEEHG